jgi:putative RecB family exonuclease
MSLEPPRTLSPSKVSSFTDCPLAFRFSVIDRLPEPASPHAVRGTLVHSVLERLIWHHQPGCRSIDAALGELDEVWAGAQKDPEFLDLGLGAEDAAAFRGQAEVLVRNYFRIEDPDRVQAVAVELGLEADLGDVRLRGIIDRLDLTEDGELVVVDYKTGGAPSERLERSRLTGVHIYAILCARVLGRAPVAVRLLYLRDPLAITATPSDQAIIGHSKRTTAVWEAIGRACSREDFRPRPGPLCRFCSFQHLCPAFRQEPAVAVAS